MERKYFSFKNIKLSYLDSEGNKPPLLIAHANGFSAECYGWYIRRLSESNRVIALDFSGHSYSDKYWNFEDWAWFRDQLGALCDHLKLEKIHAIGHSMGGNLLMRLAAVRPGLIHELVLLDPVILGRARLTFLKWFGNPLARKARKRRSNFRSYLVAYKVMAKHPFFKTWDQEILRDYVSSCFKPQGEEITLSCEPNMEAQIFDTPDIGGLHEAYKASCPITLLSPENSGVCSASQVKKIISLNAQSQYIPVPEGGHLFPFTHPDWTLTQINGK